MDGRKDDHEKLDWSILFEYFTPELEEVVRVLTFGAKKYGRDNWRHVLELQQRYSGALFRHIMPFVSNDEPYDKESGFSHGAHAICNILFKLSDMRRVNETEKERG